MCTRHNVCLGMVSAKHVKKDDQSRDTIITARKDIKYLLNVISKHAPCLSLFTQGLSASRTGRCAQPPTVVLSTTVRLHFGVFFRALHWAYHRHDLNFNIFSFLSLHLLNYCMLIFGVAIASLLLLGLIIF